MIYYTIIIMKLLSVMFFTYLIYMQKEAFDAKVEEQLDDLDKLLGSNVVSNYLRSEWIPCANMWSNFGSSANTNNLVERYVYHINVL